MLWDGIVPTGMRQREFVEWMRDKVPNGSKVRGECEKTVAMLMWDVMTEFADYHYCMSARVLPSDAEIKRRRERIIAMWNATNDADSFARVETRDEFESDRRILATRPNEIAALRELEIHEERAGLSAAAKRKQAKEAIEESAGPCGGSPSGLATLPT